MAIFYLKRLFLGLLLIIPAAAFAQAPGNGMFVAYNSDGNHGFSFVTFVDVPNGTPARFNDNEWNGMPIGSGGAFNAGESGITWTNNTGGIIYAGTVITITNLNSTPVASLGTVAGTMTLDNSNEVIYMFIGTNASTPTTFITAISNDGFGANGTLNNTGLTAGTTATAITGDEDIMVYTGSINCTGTVATCATAIATPANWSTQDTAGDDSGGIAPNFPGSAPCNFYGVAFGIVTYYSRNATLGGQWDSNTAWTTSSDGTGGPLATGVWPRRHDNVVIRSGHTITVNATNDNRSCGVSPDGLAQANIGPFVSSNLAMFYHTGDITISGTLNVTGIEMMTAGYTHVLSGGTFSLGSNLVQVGYLEVDAGSIFSSLDDLVITGSSTTVINTNSTSTDDLVVDHTDATLCGSGTATLQNGGGSQVTYSNGATVAQICPTFTVNCTGGGCTGFPVIGGGTAIGNTGPGGVDKNDGTGFLEFWLDSKDVNANGTNPANGSVVVTWSDKSGNNVDVTQNIANVATYSASGVTFNNTGYLLGSDATFPSGGSARTAYVCASIQDTADDDVLFFYGNDAASQSYGILKSGTENVRNFFFGNDLDDAGGWLPATQTKVVNTRYASSFQEIFVGGTSTATKTATPATVTGADGVQIGGWSAFSLNSTATIKEVVLYSKAINNAERIIVDNYLAAKYGTTLSSNDLYTQDNPANGDFDFDVAGVGQASDGSNHKDARGTGIVRMIVQSPSSLDNSEFLFWGHSNGGLTGNLVDVDGTIIKERLTRVWRISETGDVGSVAISFDISSMSSNPLGANLRLLIDRDGDGFADNDVAPISGSSFSGDIITFSGVNFLSGDRFTLGNTDLLNPLPIELLFFSATAEQAEVKLKWSTASEINNNFFTVQRSQMAEQWEDIATIQGAGNSQERKDYQSIDALPYAGVSYYRLKQTDYDGTYTYSAIKRVQVEGGYQLKAYPNPTSDKLTVITGFNLESDNIRLLNTLGQPVPIEINQVGSKAELEIKNIPAGVYMLQVRKGFWQQSLRIVLD